MVAVRLSGVIAAAFAAIACGTPNVAGDWHGRVGPAHFDYLVLRLTQDADAIHGTACYVVVPGSSVGGVVFKGAAVVGAYPTVTVATSGLNGFSFSGRCADDGSVSGSWWNASSAPYPMSLTRGAFDAANVSACFE